MNTSTDQPVPLLDQAQIAELREVLEHEFNDMLSTYLINAQSKRVAVVLAAAAQDGIQLREATHSMKGSARNIGAHAVAESARTIELLADQADWPGVTIALAILDDCLQRTQVAFSEL